MRHLLRTGIVVLMALGLTGCAAFRSHDIPDMGNLQAGATMAGVKKVYVQEVLKPQESGDYCFGWHGCIWGGRNYFGEILTEQFAEMKVPAESVGLSPHHKMLLHFSDTDEYLLYSIFNPDGKKRQVSKEDLDNFMEHPIKKLVDNNNAIKSKLAADEYWIDARVRYTSNSAGEWLMKSFLTGFTLTLIPVWQTQSADIDILVTNHNQRVVWQKNYKDSYTFTVEFFLLPMVFSTRSVPDAIVQNISRTAISDMIRDGVFRN
jgi:hypothetical protein